MQSNATDRKVKWLRTIVLLFVMTAAAIPLFAKPPVKANKEGVEPPLLFDLEYDGKRMPVTLNESFEVKFGEKSVRMTLSQKSHRVFDAAGIQFHYPSQHAWEYDGESPAAKIWTLDGASNSLTVIQYANAKADDASSYMVNHLTEMYGEENVKKAKSSLKLGKRTIHGTRLEIVVGGVTIVQEACAEDHKNGSILIMIQDTPNDDGSESQETTTVKKMLGETFRIED